MASLEELSNVEHDVIIVGGGIQGSFAYRDLAMRNLNPLLLEMHDFGSGTTSGSTKLAHGGLRYLANFWDWGLVRESLRERETLMKIAPHLVSEMEFIYPIYDGCTNFPSIVSKLLNAGFLPDTVRRQLQSWAVEAGLLTYNIMAEKSCIGAIIKDYMAHANQELFQPENLIGVIKYTDGKIRSPERLTLEAILDGDMFGGNSFNYTRVTDFVKDSSGRVTGVVAESEGIKYHLEGRAIINATGPWIDRVNGLHTKDSEDNLLLRVGGIHVAVPYFNGYEKFQGSALVIPAIGDRGENKMVFIVPEQDYLIIGTTETLLQPNQNSDEYIPSLAEVISLFNTIKRVLHGFNFTEEDILYAYSGVRPLTKQELSLTEASRKDLFHYDERTGIISTTGKITPARAVAERVADFVVELVGALRYECKTATTPLYGGNKFNEEEAVRQFNLYGVPKSIGQNLIQTYGSAYESVIGILRNFPNLAAQIGENWIEAQVIYAIAHEKARTIADVMLRRTDMGKRKGLGLDLAGSVGQLMGGFLSWSNERLNNELMSYEKEVRHRYLPTA